MAMRQITCATKDIFDTTPGHIISVGGPGWGPLARLTVADQIQTRTHDYYTQDSQGRRAQVYVKGDGKRRYLTTSADGISSNNLLKLPNCG